MVETKVESGIVAVTPAFCSYMKRAFGSAFEHLKPGDELYAHCPANSRVRVGYRKGEGFGWPVPRHPSWFTVDIGEKPSLSARGRQLVPGVRLIDWSGRRWTVEDSGDIFLIRLRPDDGGKPIDRDLLELGFGDWYRYDDETEAAE